MSLKEIQEEIVENKKRHNFNTTDMNEEFCHAYREVSEAYEAWYKGLPTFPEELADAAIFLLGIAELNGINLEEQIVENKKRHKFNTTDMNEEFCHVYKKVSEAYEAWYKVLPTFPEELADAVIFLLGIAELNGINLEEQIKRKVGINKDRVYKMNELGHYVHL